MRAAKGLWPERCVAGTARLDFPGVTRRRRGWPPAALSQDRCVALAGSGSRAVAPWWLPSVRHVPVAGGESVYGQSALRSPEGRPGSRAARVSPRRRPPSPQVRFASHGTCRVFTRRSRVRVPRLWRRCAVPLVKLGPFGPTVPLRSELAGSGWNYGPRRVMRANVCVNAWRARGPAMAGQAKRPAIAGRGARGGRLASMESTGIGGCPSREAIRCRGRFAPRTLGQY